MQKRVIVCSICSREKVNNGQALPARELYLGTHIKIAEEAANKENLPFFILSGKYGLLASAEKVKYYNHRLKECEVAQLAARLWRQLVRYPVEIGEIRFYAKTKPTWQLYRNALQQAADKVGITVKLIELPDDA